jgi:hypothetical protein
MVPGVWFNGINFARSEANTGEHVERLDRKTLHRHNGVGGGAPHPLTYLGATIAPPRLYGVHWCVLGMFRLPPPAAKSLKGARRCPLVG